MTEVIRMIAWGGLILSASALLTQPAKAQQKEQIPAPSTNIRIQTQTAPGRAAEELYLKLRSVGLDPQRIYHVREASLDRAQLHITLTDGTIGFTQAIDGHVTGAFFEGDGEILLVPPGESERASMMLFTKAAILEQDFATAFFRFNDETASELQPYLRAADDTQEFFTKWDPAARNLAEGDALRLFSTFSRHLPTSGESGEAPSPLISENFPDRFLHARLQSEKLGIFDVYYDSQAAEQIAVAQSRNVQSSGYYDVWASFSPPGAREVPEQIVIHRYKIDAQVTPPSNLKTNAALKFEVLRGGDRTVVFELSRNLKVSAARANGQPVELIQNQALAGTALARRGNDLLAVVFPQALQVRQQIELELSYGGDVLSEAGGGLLYVGARGIWYPNRGLSAASFDLTFHYPPGWTLLATGKRVAETSVPETETAASTAGQQSSHWITERPIPIAGFNLGRYVRATAQTGAVTVETYAARGVEKTFPKAAEQVVEIPHPSARGGKQSIPIVVAQPPPSPARNAKAVADTAARAVNFYAQQFGAYPYSSLEITQMPGMVSQGWPGLIFLSTYAFLTPEEREHMHLDPVTMVLDEQVTAHETAHQWWGDLIYWRSYRDQWISEALSDYSAMMMLEAERPADFHKAMDRYRDNLLAKNEAGTPVREAGPVTLGLRLSSSEFPSGYEAISYGRGTWLFHMLRHMLDDGRTNQDSPLGDSAEESSPFIRALRNIVQRYAGKPMTTQQMLEVFAEALPPAVRYEGKASLDWFYEGWINGTAVPRFQLQGIKLLAKGKTTVVTGTILQKDAPKELVTSVPIYAVLSGDRRVFAGRVFADGPESPFRLTVPPGTRKIVADPYDTVLSTR